MANGAAMRSRLVRWWMNEQTEGNSAAAVFRHFRRLLFPGCKFAARDHVREDVVVRLRISASAVCSATEPCATFSVMSRHAFDK